MYSQADSLMKELLNLNLLMMGGNNLSNTAIIISDTNKVGNGVN